MTWQIRRRVDCPQCGTDWPIAPVRTIGGQIEIACPRCGVLPWRARPVVPADAATLTPAQLAAYARAVLGGRSC